MATLILRRNTQGRTSGRCDAKCYNAKGLNCKCVCGGINHGKGRNQAIDNTHQFFDPGSPTHERHVIILPSVNYHLFQEEKT